MRFAFTLHLLAFVAFASTVFGQSYGLVSRPVVGQYLDGVMPAQPPAIGTNWSTVEAFPNLTFLNPLGVLPMPGTTKLVAWGREGYVWSFENNPTVATKTLMLDLHTVCQGWDDEGLLGLAFHPNFATNGYVYLWWNRVWPGDAVLGDMNNRPPWRKGLRRLSRFTYNPATGLLNPASEYVLIDQTEYSSWHKGGGMFFHPTDGFLYITTGNDANNGHDQRINGGLFGGIIRIDVDKRGGNISHAPTVRANEEVGANWPNAYFIPNDNPFVGLAGALEEFFALGLRSPHRMTVDPVTKRIFIGDVGDGSREEIDVVEPGESGLNFQYNRIEGYSGDLTPPYIGVNKRPILDYSHGGDGNAVVGGYVYRGTAFPELAGRYIFGDNGSNLIWVLDESTHTATTPAGKVALATVPKGPGPNSGNDYTGLSSFGFDQNGELLLCQLSSTGGKIYKLQRGGATSQPLPATLSATGVFSNTAALTPSAKVIPYALNQPFWSDGAIKSRWAAVPNAAKVGFSATGEWSWPEGTVLVKHFDLPVDDTNPAVKKRLETRLLVKMNGGGVYGATYKWRADNSDADLLNGALVENVPIAIAPLGTLSGGDIGAPALSGSTVRTGNTVTIQAAGQDIWGTSDQFHFARQQRTGDFDVSVRIESFAEADLYSKAGLMARESLAADSRHVFALAFPSNAARNNNDGGYEFQYRAATGGASAAIYPAAPQPRVVYPNTWLRMKRTGDTFIAYASSDGAVWSEFARTTLALPQTIFFGLAATSHTATAPTTAVFHLQTSRLQQWYYPNQTDCLACHRTSSGGVLGPKTRQLNGDLLYPNGVRDNQLRAWAHAGLFDNAPAESQISSFDKLAALDDTGATVEKRARSFLDSNCSACHRPGGVNSFWDARFDTPLAQQGLLYGTLGNNLGDPTARVVVPQDLARSVLYRRVNALGTIQMPPLARNVIDHAGVDVLAQWIASLAPNLPPVVALTSPASGSAFLQGTPIPLQATASDSDGILKVEFYEGGYKLGEATSAPYQFTWNGAQRGVHTLTAIAVDTVGNSAQSAPVTVTVQGAPLPTPWLNRDIGNVGIVGEASYGSGVFTVSGSGDDIWNDADAFHFVHRSMSGDGEIVARVVSLQNSDGWAKAGVMMRETLDANSRYSFSMISASNGAAHQFRSNTAAGADHVAGPGVAAPHWVRLVRAGDLFSAYESPDGTTWTLMDQQTIAMSGVIYVGLAVTAHNNSAINEALFDNVGGAFGQPTWTAKINFQLAGAPVPDTYLADTGAVFAEQPGGLSFGWNRDNTADARDRDDAASPDQRYDTLVHFQKDHGGGSVTSQWDIAVPNATYEVRLVVGDASHWGDSRHHLVVEGQTFIDETTTQDVRWLEASGTVVVTDGRLTIAPGANAANAKICFVEIVSYDSAVNVPPTVELTTPGGRYVNAASIPLTATASDSDGSIARVEFLVDGVKVGESTTAPFEWVWSEPSYGTHMLAARAVDNVGGSAASAPVNVLVENAGSTGFRAEYYDNADFTNLVLVRADAAIDFDWGGGSPDTRIGVDSFTVRWSGRVRPPFTGMYNFTTETDDGVRLWVNGALVINQWVDQSATRHSAMLNLTAGQTYDVVMEYYENGGDAVARLLWSAQGLTEQPIPAAAVTVPAPVLSAFEAWRVLNFGTIVNSGTAADLADPNGDGECNLLEFATAQNPLAATRSVPTLVHNGTTIDVTYTRSNAALAGGITFSVEWSNTLAPGSWSSSGVTEQLLSDNGTVQRVKATLPAGSGALRCFVRLKMTRP